jgi:hypothetical protein
LAKAGWKTRWPKPTGGSFAGTLDNFTIRQLMQPPHSSWGQTLLADATPINRFHERQDAKL